VTKPRKRIIGGSPVAELLGELDAPEEPKKKSPKVKTATPTTAKEIPEGYKLDPRYVEKKTARLQLVLKPSVADKLRKYCKAHDTSVNDFVGAMIEERLNDGK
jgi:hypothetical protein